jgi:hypothetical protein
MRGVDRGERHHGGDTELHTRTRPSLRAHDRDTDSGADNDDHSDDDNDARHW